MLELRAAIARGAPAEAIADDVRATNGLLAAAEQKLGGSDLRR